jgi:hypothetical protein
MLRMLFFYKFPNNCYVGELPYPDAPSHPEVQLGPQLGDRLLWLDPPTLYMGLGTVVVPFPWALPAGTRVRFWRGFQHQAWVIIDHRVMGEYAAMLIWDGVARQGSWRLRAQSLPAAELETYWRASARAAFPGDKQEMREARRAVLREARPVRVFSKSPIEN